jgi:hypothetical protein
MVIANYLPFIKSTNEGGRPIEAEFVRGRTKQKKG